MLRDCARGTEDQLPWFDATHAVSFDVGSDGQDVCFTVAERLRALDTGAKVLELLGFLPLDALNGYQQLQSNILKDVFGLSRKAAKLSQSEREADNFDLAVCVAHYITHLGPQLFWSMWWAAPNSRDSAHNGLKLAVEALYNRQCPSMRYFVGQASLLVKHQISHVDERARKKTGVFFSYRNTVPPFLNQAFDKPNYSEVRLQHAQLIAHGVELATPILGKIRVEQRLDYVVQPVSTAQAIAPSSPAWRCCHARRGGNRQTSGNRNILVVLPEWNHVYDQWQREWEGRKGWRVQVDEIKSRVTKLEAEAKSAAD